MTPLGGFLDLFVVAGEGAVFLGPYGSRRVTYADATASGQPLVAIERFVYEQVLPFYGNVHSGATEVAAQTEAYREAARAAVARGVGAGLDDVVVFTGAGATAAVDRLLRCMAPIDASTTVLLGPYEHHSNELPWREQCRLHGAEVVVVQDCRGGQIDLDDLAAQLEARRGRRLVGSFSAASNVTGILTDVPRIARLLHTHDALAFFDYAAAGPYVPVVMSPVDPLEAPDAVFLSPHKFLGGPGASGVLVAKRRLFQNAVPAVPGGGTVAYADPRTHVYLPTVPAREEGGTPNILGDVRAGLAFQAKAAAGAAAWEAEVLHARALLAAWLSEPGLIVLGNPSVPRLATVSFLVRHTAAVGLSAGQAKLLHHGFVAALLNDLFGIQARAGCSCAAPYGHRLLGIPPAAAAQIEALVRRDATGKAAGQGARPGWTRVSVGFQASDALVAYVSEAVRIVVRDGWRALVDYAFDPATGRWTHRAGAAPLRSLDLFGAAPAVACVGEEVFPQYLAEAQAILGGCGGRCASAPPTPVPLSEAFASLRWFWLPEEAAQELAASPTA